MEEEELRSGAVSRVESATSSRYNGEEEDIEEGTPKASSTSLVNTISIL